MLIENKVTPLTGELGMGIVPNSGINNQNLSGTSMSHLGVLTTIKYATSFKPTISNEWKSLAKNRLNFAVSEARNQAKRDPQHLQNREWNDCKFDFLRAELYIKRMKIIDPEFNIKIEKVKSNLAEIKQSLANDEDPLIFTFIENLENACDAKPFIEPTETLLNLVNHSFPIILGSTTIQGKYVDDPDNVFDEHTVRGEVPLKEMHVAFTEEEHVEQLKELLNQAGLEIEVMSLNALKILGGMKKSTI
ncbi:MAG: hypothetical protein H0T62_06255 [Parachlamydiaceae bacterium]|nr:hypothetical protein [Parachlamydiaceae bacterium]